LSPCRFRGVVQPVSGVREIRRTDYVVSLKDAAGLVPGHLHCYALWDSGSHEISDSGSSEIMRNAPRTASLDAGGLPDFVECSDRLGVFRAAALLRDHAKEYVRNDLFQRPFRFLRNALLFLQQPAQVGRHREHPSLPILCAAGIEAGVATVHPDSGQTRRAPEGIPVLNRENGYDEGADLIAKL
jgi:hypothetical protein